VLFLAAVTYLFVRRGSGPDVVTKRPADGADVPSEA
jgi:hypothetical protein